MFLYDTDYIHQMFDNSDTAETNAEKGKIFEDLICYLFEGVPGISIPARNSLNVYDTEEIDISIWNDKHADGLIFLNYVFLIECKNWTSAVGSEEVNYFASKVERRGLDFGIFIASRGITGSTNSCGRHIVSTFLIKRIQIIVIDREDILGLSSGDDLVKLIKHKICELVVNGG